MLSPRAPLTLVDLAAAHLQARLDRIGAGIPGEGLRLYGVLDVTPDVQAGLVLPCIVVLCRRDTAARNQVPDPDRGGVLQRVTATLSVTCGVRAPTSRGGARRVTDDAPDATGHASDRLMLLVERTRAALLAWAPDGQFPAGRWAPLELRAGRLAALEPGGRAWWEDSYETHRLVRGDPPAEAPGVVPSTLYSGLYDVDPDQQRGRLAGGAAC